MSKLTRHLRIYPGVDIARALRLLDRYLETENAKKIGEGSQVLFSNPTDGNLLFYATPTMYVIRVVG